MVPTIDESLVIAASTGDIDGMKTLISRHEPPSEETIQTLLTAAAKGENLKIIEFLLDQYPTVPLDEEVFRGAVNTGSIPVTKAMLTHDPAIINMPFDHRGSALIAASGADPNMDPDAAAFPLMLVAYLYTDPAAMDVLLSHGARPQDTGALATAAWKGKEAMVLRLLECGACPEAEAKAHGVPNSDSPLHAAVRNGHEGIVRLLLQYGADLNAVDHNGLTAMETVKQKVLDGKDVSKMLEVLQLQA